MAIKLIIFDLDGTLVDSLSDLTDATNHMLARFNRPRLEPEQVRKLVGQGARNLVVKALAGAADQDIAAGLEMFLAFNEMHIADKSRLYPGVIDTLSALRAQGKRLAVISNKNVALCNKLLGVLEIDTYFRIALGADSLPFRKPSPEPLFHLMRREATAPEATAIVGDSINDIAAGQGAGVTTIGCLYGYGEAAELVNADYLVDSFPQLLQLSALGAKRD